MVDVLPLPFLVEWRPMKITSSSEAFPDPCTGARRLLVSKWFVPGDVKAAGGKGYSPASRTKRAKSSLTLARLLP
jgi:hypothetical protein